MSNYIWRHEMIEKIERNGHDINGNPRYVLTLGMAGMTKRVTVAGKYWLTNGLNENDKGPAHIFMNWDTGRAKYVMFKNPASYHDFRQVTYRHVRKAMEDRNVLALANAMDVLLEALDSMEESYHRHKSVDDAYWELYSLVDSSEKMGRMYADTSMQDTAGTLSEYLQDMDKWWHDRVTETQLEKLTTYRSGMLNPQVQGFDWAY